MLLSPPTLLLILAGQPDPSIAQAAPSLTEVTSTEEEVGVDGIAGVRSVFIVSAQPDDVMDALSIAENYKHFFKTVDKVKLLSARKQELEIELTESGWLMDFSYSLRVTFDRAKRRISFVETGGDLKYFRGSWQLERVSKEGSGLTRVIYTNYADGGFFMPNSSMKSIIKELMLDFAIRLRRDLAGEDPLKDE